MNLMENNKTLLTIFVLFVLIALVGFYMAFDKIATLSTTVSNLELAQQIKDKSATPSQNEAGTTVNIPVATSSEAQQPAPAQNDIVAKIPAAIIFNTLSDAALQPQATTTITVESVSKKNDGTIQVNIKAYTPNATSYTAIDPRGIFWLVNLNGDNIMVSQVSGQFQSMPPQSSTTGQLIFKPTTDSNNIILQIGNGDMAKFYQFDFTKLTYKETVIG